MKACAPVFCKSTVKIGINRGFYCAKLDCKIKTHINIGVSKYAKVYDRNC